MSNHQTSSGRLVPRLLWYSQREEPGDKANLMAYCEILFREGYTWSVGRGIGGELEGKFGLW